MKIVEFDAVDDIDPEQWRTLWQHCADATVFQTQEWMRAWTCVFAPMRADVKLITAWDGERLICAPGLGPQQRPGPGGWAEVLEQLPWV